jgi:dTDP-4-dehydrorhamnose 3,5-epimerase
VFVTREVFWSQSAKGVFRGLHVQLPPRAARKLVFVTSGSVRDFVLDLRRGSPTEGQVHEFQLGDVTGGLVIPEGCAHGFEVLSDGAAMVYLQEDFHSPEHDTGVLYSSVDVQPITATPIVSARDLELPPMSSFDSPFEFA